MSDNDLIPKESAPFDYNSNGVTVVKRKRRKKQKKSPVFKLLIFVSISLIIISIYHILPIIQGYFFSIIPGAVGTSSEMSDKLLHDTNDESIDTHPAENIQKPPSIPDDEKIYFHNKQYEGCQLINKNEIDLSQYSFTYDKLDINELKSRYGENAPFVLIVSTSPQKSYSNGEFYTRDEEFFKESYNTSSLAYLFCDLINEKGVNAIHLNKTYNADSIYENSVQLKKDIESILNAFPSINYVFDISRELTFNQDMTIDRFTYLYNEIAIAPISITIGSDKSKLNEFQLNNLSFALDFKNHANNSNGVFKEITVSSSSLFQSVNSVFVRFEIGSFSNTYCESQEAVCLLADIFASYLS